jgi:hypothetical protein
MQALLTTTCSFYRNHKAALIACSFYLLFWWSSVSTHLKYQAAADHLGVGEKVAWGEGVMYWYLLTLAMGVGPTIVMLINAIVYKEIRTFYLIMSALVVTPLIIYLLIFGF